MSIKRINSVILVVTIVSITVHCSPTCDVTDTPKSMTQFSTTLPVPSAHTTLSEQLLDVLKNFHSSLPAGASQKTPVTETAPISPPLVNDRISVMHFPAAPAVGSINTATPNLMVPGVIHHQRPLDLNMQMPDRGYNQLMAEPSSLLMQSREPTGNPFPVSVPPPIAETGISFAPATPDQQSSSIAIPPASSRSPVPPQLKIEPERLPHNVNQELIKLLTDLRITPASLQEPLAAPGQNQMLANGPATRPAETTPFLSPGSSSSLQPLKVTQPIFGPKQTPLDYLLSSSSPMHQLNSVPGYSTSKTNTNSLPTVDFQPPPTAKPRPNKHFFRYLLNLPRHKIILDELIKAQSLIQT